MKKIKLVATNEKNPNVKLKPGMKFEVAAVQLLDPSKGKIKKRGARLCGGTDTCLALVDIEKGDPAPRKAL